MDACSQNLVEKKGRVQFINDFTTGKTKVLGKSLDFQTSIKSNSECCEITESQNNTENKEFGLDRNATKLTTDKIENSHYQPKIKNPNSNRDQLKSTITYETEGENSKSKQELQIDLQHEVKISHNEINGSHEQVTGSQEMVGNMMVSDNKYDSCFSSIGSDSTPHENPSNEQKKVTDTNWLCNDISTSETFFGENNEMDISRQTNKSPHETEYVVPSKQRKDLIFQKGSHQTEYKGRQSSSTKDNDTLEMQSSHLTETETKTELQPSFPPEDKTRVKLQICSRDKDIISLAPHNIHSYSPERKKHIAEFSSDYHVTEEERCKKEGSIQYQHSNVDTFDAETSYGMSLAIETPTNREISDIGRSECHNCKYIDQPNNNENKFTNNLNGLDNHNISDDCNITDGRGDLDTDVVQSFTNTTESATQTTFSFESIQEQFSILCEKCGHTIRMQEVLVNLLVNPLRLLDGHLCTDMEENFIIGGSGNIHNSYNEEGINSINVNFQSREQSTSKCSIHRMNSKTESFSHGHDSVFYFGKEENTESSQDTTSIHRNNYNNQGKENELFETDLNNSSMKSDCINSPTIIQMHSDGQNTPRFHEDSFIQSFREQDKSDKLLESDIYPLHFDPTDILEGPEMPSTSYEFDSSNVKVGDSVLDIVTDANKSNNDQESNQNLETKVSGSKVLPPRPSQHQKLYPNLKGSYPYKSWHPNPIYSRHNMNTNKLRSTACSSTAKFGNKSSSWHRRDMMDKLSQFAEDNLLEIHNVNADGNCMFSAVVDQLWISGVFRFTPESLRKEAVEFLKQHPNHKDGSHLESFLDDETWDEYLNRMSRIGEWGDQMILQGVSEITCFRIIVVNSEMITTRLEPWHSTPELGLLNVIHLGHMGEYHYVSLRPQNWQQSWGIRAKLRLLQELHGTSALENIYYDTEAIVCEKHHLENSVSRQTLDPLISEETKDTTKNPYNLEINQAKIESKELDTLSIDTYFQNLTINNADLIAKAQKFKATNGLMPTQEDLESLLTDMKSVDPLSTVSMEHLSFYLAQVIGPAYIYTDVYINHINRIVKQVANENHLDVVVYGKTGENLAVYPNGYNYCNDVPILQPQVLFYRSDLAVIVYEFDDIVSQESLVVETNACKPGFLRLKIPYPNVFQSCCTMEIEGQTYLTDIGLDLPTNMNSDRARPKMKKGLECQKWPTVLTAEWHTRDRQSGFPDDQMLEELSSRACFLRKSHHPNSALPEAEWQFIFPTVETDLYRDMLNTDMRYVMKLFKVIVDFYTSNLQKQLKTNHLKTVMLHCCEKFPLSVWTENIGGALLGLIGNLMSCLKERFLPHYVMLSINLLDTYTDEDIDLLLNAVEQIRLFPLMAVHVLVDKYDFFNRWIIQPIATDLHRYRCDLDILKSIEVCFCPTLIEIGRRTVMFGIHYFSQTFSIICTAYKKACFVEQERKIDTIQTIQQYIEPFLNSIDDPINRYLFTDFVDKQLKCSVLVRMTACDQVRTISKIVEKENGGYYNEFPIPDGNNLDDIEYLNKLAEYLEWAEKPDTAAHILRCGIGLTRKCMLSEVIDGSEISDEDIKVQISEKNAKTLHHLQTTLYRLYNSLINCYDKMDQKELFQEYIHEFEELVEASCVPYYYNTLSHLYQEFGNQEKADIFLKRFEESKGNIHSTRI